MVRLSITRTTIEDGQIRINKGFIVESILGHRGNRNRRSTLQFNVRWSGFDESSDSWEPYKALMHEILDNEILDNFQNLIIITKKPSRTGKLIIGIYRRLSDNFI
jgi:hypothetical protein